MSLISIGDLAQSQQLRRDNGRLKNDLNRLASELSTGRVRDTAKHLGGDLNQLSGIERGLTRLVGFATVIDEVRLEVTARQSAVDAIRHLGQGVSSALLLVSGGSDPTLVNNAVRDAATKFDSVLSALNTHVGGRSVFAGTATDSPAVADRDAILNAIEAEILIAGAVTADDVRTVVEAWFASGGGFETIGYVGGTNAIPAMALSDTETLGPPPKADDARVRAALSGFAMAALVDRGVLSIDPTERTALARQAGEALLNADRPLIDLQVEIGEGEAQVERADTEVSSETNALKIARGELISTDPFDIATQLESVETQLRSLYAVTAKLQRLSLAEYL